MATDVAHAVGGRLSGKNAHLSGASFDSRTLTMGQLFVPIIAERDGHDFIDDALARGAGAYLTSREVGTDGAALRGTAIVVPDTVEALRALGRWARMALGARVGNRVVGITGSVGKTTTKDLAAAAIGSALRVAASSRSFNNDQGVPITLLNAPDDCEALVLEMGMRGHGEITRLTEVGLPIIGVVTAIAEAHTALLDNLDGIAQAKGELIAALPSDGIAILNADDERVLAMQSRTSARVITFGEAPSATVRITQVDLDHRAHATVHMATPWGDVSFALPIAGRHSASNAAAAIAAAGACGVDVQGAGAAITAAPMSPNRMHVRTTAGGVVLIDDCYNANPKSMAAALNTLAAIPARRRTAFVGVMAELKDPDIAHRLIASLARRLEINLVAVDTNLYGGDSITLQSAILQAGQFGDGDAVLVKGSRVAGLERLVHAFG
ncbi:MAG: UDP-N-acetylmuramoyl-tripeptide--D-alanyl-D-alanine ligase [Ilumatobacteraceae bacterium]|nr:UDP-N-acetylmuramoyl-tripeptide--D-alanyl-D-alanine ligase [Ilumatobacteraceae bacterium]